MTPCDFQNKFIDDQRTVTLEQVAASLYLHAANLQVSGELLAKLASDLDAWATLKEDHA
jgi:hypothetical protein